LLLIFRAIKAHYGSQDQTSLYLINWGTFGTLQARLLIRYLTTVVIAAKGLNLLEEFIFRLKISRVDGKVFNSERKLQDFQSELRCNARLQPGSAGTERAKKEKERGKCAVRKAERKGEINHLLGAGN
jgi:hypothetical protein